MICALLAALCVAVSACTPSPADMISEKLTDLAANTTYMQNGKSGSKPSFVKGEGDGSFTVQFPEVKTFNSLFIAVDGENASVSFGTGGKVVYSGGGYCTFPEITTDTLKVEVKCEGKWKVKSLGVYDAPASSEQAVAVTEAADLLDGKLSRDDFANVSAVVLHANVLFDSNGTVSYAAVNGESGESYFSRCVNALKSLTTVPIYMQADAMNTEGDVPEPSYVRYHALRTNRNTSVNNLSAAVRRYGLQGMHIDFSDSSTESTAIYYMGEFAQAWRNTGTLLAVTWNAESWERSAWLADTFAKVFRDDMTGEAYINYIILNTGGASYEDVVKFCSAKSDIDLTLALPCEDGIEGVAAFAIDCGATIALTHYNSSGARALKAVSSER